MHQFRTLVIGLIVVFATGSSLSDEPSAQNIDEITGLIKSGDWQLVRNNCTACHSAKIITQQSGSATQWLTLIRWMQREQNLWQFEEGTENRIISYLAKNYAPKATRRRAPIPPSQMPPTAGEGA